MSQEKSTSADVIHETNKVQENMLQYTLFTLVCF